MISASYQTRRDELLQYFDRTAADAWAKLTGDGKVSRIRETVRAGRNAQRDNLLSWLPQDLGGARLLDAGCGTGALAVAAAERGADVLAVDLSPSLIALAQERLPQTLKLNTQKGRIRFHVGDMTDAALSAGGDFDFIVAMDSLIHYRVADMVGALDKLSSHTKTAILFTFAPKTPLLQMMHWTGKVFPRGDRSPAIVPVSFNQLRREIAVSPGLAEWQLQRNVRVNTSFYISHAVELGRQ